jgi:hypothetical protein
MRRGFPRQRVLRDLVSVKRVVTQCPRVRVAPIVGAAGETIELGEVRGVAYLQEFSGWDQSKTGPHLIRSPCLSQARHALANSACAADLTHRVRAFVTEA